MNSDQPAAFEQKLGFDQIRAALLASCLSPLGREWVGRMAFSTDAALIGTSLRRVAEMKQILQFEERFPAQDYYDLVPELLRIRIPGTFMETETLSELKLSLVAISGLLRFLEERRTKFPALFKLASEADENTGFSPVSAAPLLYSVAKEVERIVDDRSEVRDTASTELHRIRKELNRLQSGVESRILQSFRMARQNGWTPDDAEVTIRNGRLVIPMISAHKRKIQGFVHDESSTGQTVYVEPAEIFETNNEIRELEYAERREIVKILTEFATFLRPGINELIHAYQFLGKTDFIRSKASFALETGGECPIHLPAPETADKRSADAPAFTWVKAIHPLLHLSLRRQNRSVIPLDIDLNPDRRILIISGPNAGGKSVCLKTVGLVQYMFQCGLLPTAREDSEFCIFNRILIDIGDEQSIDNDLSTYSSKLINLKFFLENIDSRSLFLIDEMGTGTDPSLGGAIAEATLEALNGKKAMGIVTTHYSNLKLLASRETGIVNGAMLYDLKKLKPLYQLKVGQPGSSFAFEIAQQIGFPAPVLEHAKEKTGKSQLDFDRELQNLEVEKQEITKKNTELRVADDFLAELIEKYEKLTADLEAKKQGILIKAREEAKQILDRSNQAIEKTIREIRETQAEKERTKEVRRTLEEEKRNILAGRIEENFGNEQKKVRKDKEAAEKALAERKELVGSQAPPKRFQKFYDDLNAKLTNFSLTLDLRGFRVEEAVPELTKYIDDAILFSIPEVRILHGKGNGVLRQVTRDYLRSQKEVKGARDAPVDAGGAGITVVTFL